LQSPTAEPKLVYGTLFSVRSPLEAGVLTIALSPRKNVDGIFTTFATFS